MNNLYLFFKRHTLRLLMATEIRVHKQKKKAAKICIKNVGMKRVKRCIQLIKAGRKNMCVYIYIYIYIYI